MLMRVRRAFSCSELNGQKVGASPIWEHTDANNKSFVLEYIFHQRHPRLKQIHDIFRYFRHRGVII